MQNLGCWPDRLHTGRPCQESPSSVVARQDIPFFGRVDPILNERSAECPVSVWLLAKDWREQKVQGNRYGCTQYNGGNGEIHVNLPACCHTNRMIWWFVHHKAHKTSQRYNCLGNFAGFCFCSDLFSWRVLQLIHNLVRRVHRIPILFTEVVPLLTDKAFDSCRFWGCSDRPACQSVGG